MATIRNPIQWSVDQLRQATAHAGSVGEAARGREGPDLGPLTVRQIGPEDLRDALRRGAADFAEFRTDVAALCVIYPLAGLVLAWAAFDYDLLPLLFPAASGFALIGPAAAVGLYELSRRRERGERPTWIDALSVVASPSFGAILLLALGLVALFVAWLVVAQEIYMLTLGPDAPVSLGALVRDALSTPAGLVMTVVGIGTGFLFAVVALVAGAVSFPLLLDRDVGLRRAVATSIRVSVENPRTMALWGLIVAGGLVAGSIPLFLGLIFVMPTLGHATWHLYRKAVVPPDGR